LPFLIHDFHVAAAVESNKDVLSEAEKKNELNASSLSSLVASLHTFLFPLQIEKNEKRRS